MIYAKEKTMTKEEALKIVLDFVERWNKQDKETEVAEAAQVLSETYEKAFGDMFDDPIKQLEEIANDLHHN